MSNPTELPDLGQQRAILIVNEDGIELAIECRGDGKWQFASILNDRPHMSFARRAQPAGEAPQAEVYEVWNYAHECWSQTDKNGYLASHQNNRRIVPAATLSPLCGAQHAESGKEADAAYDILLEVCRGAAHALIALRGMVSDPEHVAFINRALADPQALAAQQAAAPGALGWINDVVCDVCELPDRDSPAGTEDMLLVTINELHDIIERHAPSAPGTPEAPSRNDVLEEAAQACEAWGNAKVMKWAGDPEMLEDAKARAWDGLQCAAEIRELKQRAAQLDGGQEGSES